MNTTDTRRVTLGAGIRRHHPAQHRPKPSPEDLTSLLREQALELGFARFGVVRPREHQPEIADLEDFLAQRRHGQMAYLGERDEEGQLTRTHPRCVLPGVSSIISVALRYPKPPGPDVSSSRLSRAAGEGNSAKEELVGRVAGYAGGDDYHHLFKERLLRLADALAELAGEPVEARPAVDTAPIWERQVARDAGVAFVGKNTLAISPGPGSYVLLGELLTSEELAPTDEDLVPEGCGRCRSCLDACPTGALDDAYRIDARRCISYLTIEATHDIPEQFRSALANRVFGCDECQVVCPYNQSEKAAEADPALEQREFWASPSLVDLLFATSSQHRKRVRGTALRRTTREQLARNAAVALGNSGSTAAVAPLERALLDHFSEQVQRHVAWALGNLWQCHGLTAAHDALLARREHPRPSVREAIAQALEQSSDVAEP